MLSEEITELKKEIAVLQHQVAELESRSTRQEEILRLERDLLDGIIQTSIAAITIVNPQGEITFANKQAQQILGLTKDKGTQHCYDDPGWKVTDFDGNPWPDKAQPFRRVMTTGQPVFDVQHAIEWPDGQRRYLSINGAPLFDEAGHIINAIFLVHDITDRRQAELTLKKSEAQLRAILNSGSQAIVLIDQDYRVQMSNRAADERIRQTFGRIRQIGESMLDYVPAIHQETFKQNCQHAWQGESINLEAEVRFSPTQTGWFEMSFNPVITDDGQVLGVCFTSTSITERKRAEFALRESEARFRALIRDVHVGVLLQGVQAEILASNQAALDMLGLTEAQLHGKSSFDPDWRAIHEDGSPFPGETHPVPTAIATRQSVRNVVMGVYRPNYQDWVWLLVNAEPQLDQQGQVQYVVCSFTDISDRKRVEDEIYQRNQELHLLNQVIAASAADLPVEAILETTCRELAQTFKVPRATATLFNPAKSTATIVAAYAGQPPPPQTGQTFDISQTKLIHHLLHRKTPLFIADVYQEPNLIGHQPTMKKTGIGSMLIIPLRVKNDVIGTITLETEKPRNFSPEEQQLAWNVGSQAAGSLTRARLAENRRHLSAAIEQTAESVLITDIKGVIEYVNPAFERISGYDRTEAIGRTPALLKSGQVPESVYQDLWQAISTGQVWHGHLINRRKNGELYTDETTITPVRNDQGQITHYVSVQRDVTRELELEAQLRQSQKMEAVGQLAGGLAHDFNNILTAIIGHANLAMDLISPEHPIYTDLQGINQSAERAASLTRQLLTFARGQLNDPRVVNLNDLILNMDRMLRRLISENIELITLTAQDLGQVKIDPNQFEQVLINLVVNARDAMPRGGKLFIETATVKLEDSTKSYHGHIQPGNYVMLMVKDTGVGIDPETMERIFEPFFTTKPMGHGTGLGLATCFGIIKQNDGHIRAESRPGQGSTFRVYLPQVNQTSSQLPEQAVKTHTQTGTETIMLVEDEPAVRKLTAHTLRRYGYTVLEAADGEKALQLIKAELNRPIDLVITDIVMPIMGGQELRQALAVLRPELPVLFISGYIDENNQTRPLLGKNFLHKPFTPQQLADRVRMLLDYKQAKRHETS